MINLIAQFLPVLLITFILFILFRNRPLLGIKLIIILSFFIPGVIYWLNLSGNFKYLLFFISLILFLTLYSNAEGIKPFTKNITLFLIFISISTLLIGGINLFFAQNLIGYIFLFIPLYISINYTWTENEILGIFKMLITIWAIQLVIASIQKFFMHLHVDYISGSLGRAETQNISVLGSLVLTIGVGLFYFFKKKTLPLFLIISSMYFFIISEAKAGFIFSLIGVSILPFFSVKKNFNKTKYLFLILFVSLISYISIFYILPNYLDIPLAANIFSDPEALSNYLSKDYSDRYVRFAAFDAVYYEVLKNPQNLLFGYGLGSITVSPILGESQIGYNMLYSFSMASELVIYLIQVGIIGSLLFISIFIYFAMQIWGKSKKADIFLKFLCYLFFSFNVFMIISFIFYARPFRSYYLTFLLFLGIGMIYQLKKKEIINLQL